MSTLRVQERELTDEGYDGYGTIYYYKGKPFTGTLLVDDGSFEQEYVGGYADGLVRTFYPSGKLHEKYYIKHQNPNGTYETYYETGELMSRVEYDMSRRLSGYDYDKSGKIIKTYEPNNFGKFQ